MFAAGDFAQDDVLRQRSLLAGLAAAECVSDKQRRSELFLLLRPVGPWLKPAVRRELTRAVERLEIPELRYELYTALGRFFIFEREQEAKSYKRKPQTNIKTAPIGRKPWDLFISYSTDDLAEARSLAFQLKSRGVRVFLSADELDAAVGSTSWTAAIDKALSGCNALLVLLTEAARDSKWVEEEWRKYYRLMVDTGSGQLLSLRLGGPPITELPLTLRMYQCIEPTNGRIEPGHLTRIMDIVKGK